jgi:hypothetical protein
MDRRREDRFDQRMGCQLELNGQRHHGLVLNVSPRGLFVQTPAKAPKAPNVVATVEMLSTKSDAVLTLQAVVVGQYGVPDQPPGLAKGGMGLVIRSVSDAWSELLADLDPKKLLHGGSEAMPLLHPVARTGCRYCGREKATLWSGVCGWCSGAARAGSAISRAEPKRLPRMLWAKPTEVPTRSERKDGVG